MTFSSDFQPDFDRIRAIRNTEAATISELVTVAGLDQSKDFRFADLIGVDWRETDKALFDLTGSVGN